MRCLACNAVIETEPVYYRGKSPVCSQACAATKEVHSAHRPITHAKGPIPTGHIYGAKMSGGYRIATNLEFDVDTAKLLARFHEVPHTCTDPTCPGMENKRKLKLYDRLLEFKEIAEGQAAIAKAEGRETT